MPEINFHIIFRNWFVFITTFFFSYTFSQEDLNKKAMSSGLVFENIFTNNGLPDNRIRSIYQNHNGYLWIGTMNGLVRYDGYTFKQFYKKNNESGLAGNWVYAITEDAHENMWIGTTEGLSKIERSTGKIINYISSEYLTDIEIRSLYIDRRQRVWIGTKEGLSIYNPETNESLKLNTGHFKNTINSIERDAENRIWVSCETGLIVFNETNLANKFLPIQVKSNPYGDKIWDICAIDNNIYIGTGGNGILTFNTKSLDFSGDQNFVHTTYKEIINNIEVFDLVEGDKGKIWAGTDRGLGEINFNNPNSIIEFSKKHDLNSFSLSNDKIFKIHFDNSNNLWIGSEKGVNLLSYNNLNFLNYSFLEKTFKDEIRAITSTHTNTLIIETASKGVFEFDEVQGTSKQLSIKTESEQLQLGRSISIYNNTLLLGTLDGVLLKERNTGKEKHILLDKDIFSIVSDTINAKSYIGAIDGLYIYDHIKREVVSKTPIINGFVRTLYISPKNDLWVGTDRAKIYKKAAVSNSFKKIMLPDNFHGSKINAIEIDKEQSIWIGTHSGLNKLTINKDGTYSCVFIDETNGLLNKSVNGLIIDNQNNIWISTISGITKYNQKNSHFEYFLPSLIFTPSSFHKQSDHSFLFGHSEGFIKFNPNEVSGNTKTHKTQITSLRISNKEVGVNEEINGDIILKNNIENTEKITLNYKNNIFTIDFADLNGNFDANRQYAYKLVGFDVDWVNNKSNEHSATYTNLDDNDYTFLVKAKNQDNTWSKDVKQLKIKILPPPWKSWWAIGGYILLLNGLIFLFVRVRIVNANKENQLLLEKQEKAQIKELNNQRLQFFTNISHEFRTPLTLISGPIKDIVNDASISIPLRKKAKVIEKNTARLIYLINELITFRELGKGYLKLKMKSLNILKFCEETIENFQLFAEKKEVIISCQSSLKDNMIIADPVQLYKVISNLVANALKFCPYNSVINIKIQEAKNKSAKSNDPKSKTSWVSISVIDEGKGIPQKHLKHLFDRFYKIEDVHAGSGIGLSLVKEIVELHDGNIKVESKPGKTEFIIVLPKGNTQDGSIPVMESIDSFTEKLKPEFLLVDETLDTEEAYGEVFGEFDKKDILLVDDNNELLEYLNILLKEGYKIRTANNGVEALEKIEKKSPDLIVSDVLMPKMDGYELCEKIKTNPKTQNIPFILLTAKSLVNEKIKGLHKGADDYLSKPFSPDILKTKIYMLLKNRTKLINSIKTAQSIDFKKISRNPVDEKFLKKVIHIINQNLDNDDFSVEELSDIMAMSRSNLFRKIKLTTKMSPVEFLYYLRLQEAMKLLLERKLSISEITWKVGFKNPSSFSKSFKKQYGKSPSDYLNDLLKNR